MPTNCFSGADSVRGAGTVETKLARRRPCRRLLSRCIGLRLCVLLIFGVGIFSARDGVGQGSTTPSARPPRGAVIERDRQPVYVIADGKAGARILLDGSTVPGLSAGAMTELVMQAGATVPEHRHDDATEWLYILEGQGLMKLDGREQRVRAGMAIYIPPGVPHSLIVDTKVEPLRAIQLYTPGGAEQRFKKGTAVSN